MGKDAKAATVHDKLAQHYPRHVIAWVRSAKWSRQRVPLSNVTTQPRPGHPHDAGKVTAIRQAIRSGKPMKPVVLVDNGHRPLKIADGYHRTMAQRAEGHTHTDAYVGKVGKLRGPWSRAMHDAKLNT